MLLDSSILSPVTIAQICTWIFNKGQISYLTRNLYKFEYDTVSFTRSCRTGMQIFIIVGSVVQPLLGNSKVKHEYQGVPTSVTAACVVGGKVNMNNI